MKGLIGFFDILGYQSFLENNENIAGESAEKVLKIINEIPEKLKLSSEGLQASNEFKDYELKHLIFSDTVVLMLDQKHDASDTWIKNAREFMFRSSAILSSQMFINGLPMNAVIHEGDYLLKGTSLAGKGVVEAYRQCHRLDFAGTVLSEELGDLVRDEKADFPMISNESEFYFSYLSPLKEGKEKRLIVINWLPYLREMADNYEEIVSDIESFVWKSFWAHSKECSQSVNQKVFNTTKLLRKMKLNLKAIGG